MWNTHPRHGILEFMKMKEHPYTWKDYGGEKPYVKKKPWATNTRMMPKSRTTFNDI